MCLLGVSMMNNPKSPKSPFCGPEQAFQAKYAKNSNSYMFRSVYHIDMEVNGRGNVKIDLARKRIDSRETKSSMIQCSCEDAYFPIYKPATMFDRRAVYRPQDIPLDNFPALTITPPLSLHFSQPSIYIDGWLYGMTMTSVTFRCCLKTIPHIIILSSRHASDIPSLPGRQVSSSQSRGITP